MKLLLPYGPMLTKSKKKMAKNPKFEISKFFEQLRSMHIFRSGSDVYFQRRWRLNFSPISSHVNENEKEKKEAQGP